MKELDYLAGRRGTYINNLNKRASVKIKFMKVTIFSEISAKGWELSLKYVIISYRMLLTRENRNALFLRIMIYLSEVVVDHAFSYFIALILTRNKSLRYFRAI